MILLFDNNNKTKQPKHYQEEQAKKRFNGTDELRKLKCEQAVCPNYCKTEMCECIYENNKGNYEYIKCENIK
ncbi:MAG: hypothetical protein K6G37_01710 [Bacilli bacterium]|nr:hypothetical protein [Bacilli bacterium]